MKAIPVNAGDKYGELEVIREIQSKGKRHVLCKCSCGNDAIIRLGHLRSGHSSTCGRCGIEFKGKRRTISEWAKLYKIKESTLRARLKIMGIGEALKRGKDK